MLMKKVENLSLGEFIRAPWKYDKIMKVTLITLPSVEVRNIDNENDFAFLDRNDSVEVITR